MSKPPPSTPHSDMNGVHEDAKSNIDAANAAGQDSEDLEQAKEKSIGRPTYSDDPSHDDEKEGRDDRSK